jgi:membrane protein insertase Oxa1/YidC/SpoIIIJ|tara:strand:+ start:165 stop:425 length:261 start_codon:yes stop_codon:yes gene_type:complete
MDETIFWVWNGWGILFTGVVALWQFLHMLVTIKLGSGTPLRKIVAWIMPIGVILTFFFSGWVAGLLSLPIGMMVGVSLARIVIPPR